MIICWNETIFDSRFSIWSLYCHYSEVGLHLQKSNFKIISAFDGPALWKCVFTLASIEKLVKEKAKKRQMILISVLVERVLVKKETSSQV
jgi:hypothetical protein